MGAKPRSRTATTVCTSRHGFDSAGVPVSTRRAWLLVLIATLLLACPFALVGYVFGGYRDLLAFGAALVVLVAFGSAAAFLSKRLGAPCP